MGAADHHTQLRHSLGEIAHLKPFKPKKKKKKKPMALRYLSNLYIEHEAT